MNNNKSVERKLKTKKGEVQRTLGETVLQILILRYLYSFFDVVFFPVVTDVIRIREIWL